MISNTIIMQITCSRIKRNKQQIKTQKIIDGTVNNWDIKGELFSKC